MTSLRTLYGLFAIAAAAGIGLVACGPSGPPPGSPEALYVNLGCAKCHGDNRQGQRSGPPLNALDERWNVQSLTEYISDPKAVMEKNPRLKYMAENYPIAMPAFAHTSKEDLQKLAQFILSH
jgi:mono/diheme cytochrome c family protein